MPIYGSAGPVALADELREAVASIANGDLVVNGPYLIVKVSGETIAYVHLRSHGMELQAPTSRTRLIAERREDVQEAVNLMLGLAFLPQLTLPDRRVGA
jgi:hypothetical protein